MMRDDIWRVAQAKLPLTIGEKYQIECLFSGIHEGIYSGHDATEEFVSKNIGAYHMFIGNSKIWSRNILNVESV